MKNPLGKVSKEKDGYKVRFERIYDYPVHQVWNAITDPEKMRIWFTDVEMDFKEGGDITIYFRDEKRTPTRGKVVTIRPLKLFEFSWEHELARWELFEEGKDKCKLVLTYSKLEEQFAYSAPSGLHWLLDRLDTTLAGRSETYPFGMNDNDPDQQRLQAQYEKVVLAEYPELIRLKPVVVERTFEAPIEKIWQALTDKEQMKLWYFDVPDFEPKVGAEFSFFGGTEDEQWLHLCKVTEAKAPSLIAYTWRYDGHPGGSQVKFELFKEADQTRLRLTHSGLHTFPAEVDAFKKQNFIDGWNGFMMELEKYLQKVAVN